MRSGDRLQFTPESLSLRLQTRTGGVELKPEQLREVLLDLPKGGVHRVTFTNSSTLGGIVEPDVLKIETAEFGPQEIDRNLVRSIEFCNAPVSAEGLTQLSLTGGNRLFGQLDVKQFDLKGPYGTAQLSPANISSIMPRAEEAGRREGDAVEPVGADRHAGAVDAGVPHPAGPGDQGARRPTRLAGPAPCPAAPTRSRRRSRS